MSHQGLEAPAARRALVDCWDPASHMVPVVRTILADSWGLANRMLPVGYRAPVGRFAMTGWMTIENWTMTTADCVTTGRCSLARFAPVAPAVPVGPAALPSCLLIAHVQVASALSAGRGSNGRNLRRSSSLVTRDLRG